MLRELHNPDGEGFSDLLAQVLCKDTPVRVSARLMQQVVAAADGIAPPSAMALSMALPEDLVFVVIPSYPYPSLALVLDLVEQEPLFLIQPQAQTPLERIAILTVLIYCLNLIRCDAAPAGEVEAAKRALTRTT